MQRVPGAVFFIKPPATLLAAILLVLPALAAAPLTAAGAENDGTRFEPSPLQDAFAYNAASRKPVTVVLKLAGQSVAEAQSRAPGRKLDPTQRSAIKETLNGQHATLKTAIATAGGTVLADYRFAYNGIKVSIAPDRVSSLARLPGVVAVRPVAEHRIDNATTVPYIGAPKAWEQADGLRGEGVRIAIIDTGIDYTHANFDGPGTVEAYEDEHAAARRGEPADPAFFGPEAPKVKGGIDLVGDDYDAGSPDPERRIPHPGPNPIDCNGHGSHVGGTAAGFGLDADGATYRGPYDTTTHSRSFRIGPGVAPLADLYAVKVFGCSGTTNVVVEALDWAVEHEMDVVNMSLGSSYGRSDDPSTEAADNASQAGILVIASAGNAGPAPYIVGSPSIGKGTISVAAVDSGAVFPGFNVALSTGRTLAAINANGAGFGGGTLPVKVLRQAGGAVSLGCSESDYVDVTGKLVVTMRGICARVDRAIFGQRRGAAAVAMINTDAGFPPFEGAIGGVTIPFLGVKSTDGATLVAADGGTATLTSRTVDNPNFRGFAGFTSLGPTRLDSHLKPDVSAPGVSVVLTGVCTGDGAARISGTSMAAPHVAGVAALTRQAHPDWTEPDLRAAIVNTASSDGVAGYRVSRGGGGLVQPLGAVRTSVVAVADEGDTNLSFGFEESARDFSGTRTLTARNLGGRSATFRLAAIGVGGSPHTTSVNPTSLVVPAGGSATVTFSLNVPAATVGSASGFREVAGVVKLTPASPDDNAGVGLTVPYYLVPRGRSKVGTELSARLTPSRPQAYATVRNEGGARSGDADFFAWSLEGSSKGLGPIGLRAVGVQSLPRPGFPNDRILVFAVNTFERWSAPNPYKFEIFIDSTGSGTANFLIVGQDLGRLLGDSYDDFGRMAAAVVNLNTGSAVIRFLAPAPTDGSTIELPVRASDLGLTPANPRFSFTAASSYLRTESTDTDAITEPGRFNAFLPAISQGQHLVVPPSGVTFLEVSLNPSEWERTPARGLMVVTLDNLSGADQAQLFPAG